MIYHPYQFMKPELHHIELCRYLALDDSQYFNMSEGANKIRYTLQILYLSVLAEHIK